MNKTFSQGNIVRFKEGLHQDFVLITQSQFDIARQHYNDSTRQAGDQTMLVQEGEYKTAHPGDLMYIAACRPNHQLMLLLGEARTKDGYFTAAFVNADMLDIVE